MIRSCTKADFATIYDIINESAEAYRGVIPDDCWKDPYMAKEELQREIDTGVKFSGFEKNNELVAVMGIQNIEDVTLIRHAYTQTKEQKQGISKKLLQILCSGITRPILIGTWAASHWAIKFYQNNGFALVSDADKEYLLRRYWDIPERQIVTSVVLSNVLGTDKLTI